MLAAFDVPPELMRLPPPARAAPPQQPQQEGPPQRQQQLAATTGAVGPKGISALQRRAALLAHTHGAASGAAAGGRPPAAGAGNGGPIDYSRGPAAAAQQAAVRHQLAKSHHQHLGWDAEAAVLTPTSVGKPGGKGYRGGGAGPVGGVRGSHDGSGITSRSNSRTDVDSAFGEGYEGFGGATYSS